MKNTINKTTSHLSKFIILFSFILIAFTVGDNRSAYNIPNAAYSIFLGDLDMDEDIDIVTGHLHSSTSDWGGGAFLINDGNGYFELVDSIFFNRGFPSVNGDFIDDNNFIDIYSITVTNEPYTIYISIIYNYGLSQFDSIKSFPIYSEPPLPFLASGDVNGDGFADLLFAYNNDFLWGVIYNDGTGNFSEPEYFDLDYPPLDIACADLNNDGRSDVVLNGSYNEVYFSTETGFEQLLLGYLLPWSLGGHTLLISDFDNDNDNDVVFYATHNSNYGAVYMYENLGHNEFYEHDYFYFSPFCSYAQIADFNNDSLPDMIFTADDNSGLIIYNNMGDFQLELNQFIPVNCNLCFLRRFACKDLDNNGFIDIAAIKSTNYYMSNNLITLYNNKGIFQDDPVAIIEKNNQNISIAYYPNPFSEFVNIEFSVKEQNAVDLSVFDINGKHIKSITNKIYSPGKYKLKWNGRCKNGKEVNNGTYLIRLKTGPPKDGWAGSHIQTERVFKI